MKKVLITGTAGFIGMHTALRLAKEGFEVTGLDNINSYYEQSLKYARLEQQGIEKENIQEGRLVSSNNGISFIKLDLGEKEKIFSLFREQKFDYVVHLAAQAGVRYSLEEPQVYVDSNMTGTLNILEACKTFEVGHLVYASSSSVYGLNLEIPYKELHSTEHPVSFYAATKKANEMMAHSYALLYKLPCSGLRFFTVYGPWGRPDMALFKFTRNIIEEKPIEVYNFGNMLRDFTYIDDIVEGIYRTMKKVPETNYQLDQKTLRPDSSKAPYEIYNIGAGKPVKLLDFIKAIEKKLDRKAILDFKPLQKGDMLHTYADTSKLKKSVDYNPSTGLEKGISDFVDWYLAYYHVK